MAGDIVGTDLFDATIKQSLPARVRRYKEEAARFRRMAQLEGDEKLRGALVALAEQYEELAGNIAPQQYN